MWKRSQCGIGTILVVLAAAAALGALGIAGYLVFRQSDPTPWNKPATVDGAVVRFTYTGSECQDSAEVEVREETDRVVITVHEIVRARSRSDVGVPHDVEVRLDAPLADRELVDGACKMPEYADYVQCGSEKATVEDRTPR